MGIKKYIQRKMADLSGASGRIGGLESELKSIKIENRELTSQVKKNDMTENIQLGNGREIEEHSGSMTKIVPKLLAKCRKGDGIILSEADIRFLGVRDFRYNPRIFTGGWDSSTLIATYGDRVKVILPYETGKKELTKAAEYGLSLINSSETLIRDRINLNINNRWSNLDGHGVYTLNRNELYDGDLTRERAMKDKLLLIKLGHPNYVDSEFARPKDEVAEIIERTFYLGTTHFDDKHKVMMNQRLPEFSRDPVLSICSVGSGGEYGRPYWQIGKSQSFASGVDFFGKFAFDKFEGLEALTTDYVYSAIKDHIDSTNEKEVKKILNELGK